MTQEELAFESRIDLTYVGGIERGKRNPSLMVMARISEALSVPLNRCLNSCKVDIRANKTSSSGAESIGLVVCGIAHGQTE